MNLAMVRVVVHQSEVCKLSTRQLMRMRGRPTGKAWPTVSGPWPRRTCADAMETVQALNSQETKVLWAMVKTGNDTCELNSQEMACALWAVAKTVTAPELFAALCQAAAAKRAGVQLAARCERALGRG